MIRHLASIALVAVSALPAVAHEDHCAAIAASVADAGFGDQVTVTCTDSHAIISSDTYPDHELMTGITATNEQVPVPAEYAAPVLLDPKLNGTPLTRDAALGVAVNGVPIYDYTGGGEMSEADLKHHQVRHDTLQTGQLDVCGGHAGRGDDYHYHVAPICMMNQMENAGPDAIVGWAFDGFPIYGDTNPDSTAIVEGTLDVCNGQIDDTFGYRYHTSQDAPYIVQCLMGSVEDFDQLPRVHPLSAANGGEATSGRPPQGGVENLVFIQNTDGGRSMDYRYQGQDYYIRYTPSGKEHCYNYTTSTDTNNGDLVEGEFCR